MPNRILREGILTSPRMAKLGWPEEVFYRRLHSVADDFGRFYADPGLLRAACYPRQLNKVSDSDIGKWLRACVDAALVRVYPAQDGESYLEVLDFDQQIRAKKSKFPHPPSTCVADAKHLPEDAHLDVSVSVSESCSPTSSVESDPEPPKDDRFESFWERYPKKVGKGAARKTFAKLEPSAALLETMLAALDAQSSTEQWKKADGQFIPLPVTWLNQERWLDDTSVRLNGHGTAFEGVV